MTIGFKQIPSNIRVPLFYAEVDPTHANTATINQRALIIGQKTSAGVAVPNIPIISQGVSDAKVQGGIGSMLARMTFMYRQNDPFGELWYLPLSDDGSAVAAAGNVAFTGPATAAGTLALYVGGFLVAVGVTSGMTAAQLATAVVAKMATMTDLPVTSAVDGSITSKVNITAKNLGLVGNDIDIRLNYQGSANGEVMPAGIAATITAMASGSLNPSLTTALANLGDMPFDFIICPYTDATSLNSIRDFLGDVAGRWSWQTQIFGHCYAAFKGSFAGCVTLGTGRNDQHCSIMGVFDSPTWTPEWAAAMAAQDAISKRADPGLPMQTVPLIGIKAPPVASRFPLTERNSLLFDGISTFEVGNDGTVMIENIITTYQQNGFGQPDNSYLQVETMFQLMAALRALKTLVTTKYARVKLAADGTRFAPGSNIVTPSLIKADLIAQYQELEFAGLVQASAAFAAGLIVAQNAANPSRVDVLWDGIFVPGLRIFALLAQFRNQP